MKTPQQSRPPLSFRRRCRDWRADMTLRHKSYRVLLHVCGIARCPRNVAWHWEHILREFHEPKPRS